MERNLERPLRDGGWKDEKTGEEQDAKQGGGDGNDGDVESFSWKSQKKPEL